MSRYREPYTIYKRGKYWYYRYYDLKGVRIAGKSTGKKSKNEARAYCEELLKKGLLNTSNKSFESYAAGFFLPNSFYFADRITPPAKNTILIYSKNLENYIMPFFKGYSLNDINYILLKTFRTNLINKGIAFNTIKSIIATLNIILTAAYRAGYILENPLERLEPLKNNIEHNIKDSFTLNEIKLIYEKISDKYKNLILILALTGLRISEAAGVTDDDIKLYNGVFYIDLKKQFNRGSYIPLKTKLNRVIPITQEIKKLFNNLVKSESDKIYFYNEFKALKPLINDFENRNLTPHSLRHFFITNCKACGLNDSKVEFLAGHSLKGITGIYTNYKIDDLLELVTWQEETLKKIIG